VIFDFRFSIFDWDYVQKVIFSYGLDQSKIAGSPVQNRKSEIS